MAEVNSIGHVSTADTVRVVNQPQIQHAENLDKEIANELTRKTGPSPNLVPQEPEQSAQEQSDGLTTEEYILKDLYIENIVKIDNKAALNEILLNLANYPNILNQPDVQEALKAKNSEIM